MAEQDVICYRNAGGDLLIVPVAKNPVGWGVSINRVQRMTAQNTERELGNAIRDAAKLCDYSLYDPNVGNPQVFAAGEKSYSHFVKKWQEVTVEFSDIVKVYPSTRDKRGNYWSLLNDVYEAPKTVSNEDLGQAVKDAFRRCREGERQPGAYPPPLK